MTGYAHPELLVETGWVAAHGREPGIRLVEVDVDTTAYEQGHIPGARGWNWTTELCDRLRRDILSKAAFEELMARSGMPTTRPSSSTATATTGSPPGRSGR